MRVGVCADHTVVSTERRNVVYAKEATVGVADPGDVLQIAQARPAPRSGCWAERIPRNCTLRAWSCTWWLPFLPKALPSIRHTTACDPPFSESRISEVTARCFFPSWSSAPPTCQHVGDRSRSKNTWHLGLCQGDIHVELFGHVVRDSLEVPVLPHKDKDVATHPAANLPALVIKVARRDLTCD